MFNTSLFSKCKSFVKTVNPTVLPSSAKIFSDSRKIESGKVFIALSGPSFDALDFVSDVISNGCKVIIGKQSEKFDKLVLAHPKSCFVEVIDPIAFLQELASERIDDWKEKGGHVIGITGSNGKTTHKEMLYQLLTKSGLNVAFTKGNLNNHIGVPFTILDIEDSEKFAIIEMGTNHPGEIPFLCEISKPDSALITNVGESHLEFFGSKENVFKEKRTLFDYLVKNKSCGYFIKNCDDEFLSTLTGYEKTLSFGVNAEFEVITSKSKILITHRKNRIELTPKNIREDFNLRNLACCFLMAKSLIANEAELIKVANSIELPENNRCVWIKRKNTSLFLDAYNANPTSMLVSIKSFIESIEETHLDSACFIVGDMYELGDRAEELHNTLGKNLFEMGLKNVYFVGRYSEFYKKGFGSTGNYVATKQELEELWPKMLSTYSFIFLKGSRTLQLESLLDIT